jgi:hypothetical protein
MFSSSQIIISIKNEREKKNNINPEMFFSSSTLTTKVVVDDINLFC